MRTPSHSFVLRLDVKIYQRISPLARRLADALMLSVLAIVIYLGLMTDFAQAFSDQWRYEWPNTDFSNHSVDLGEIFSGGPPKDGIPSIDNPRFVPVAETDLPELEPVIGVIIGDTERAYPLRVLIWHEIVNDELNGVPVAVTYCPLCNTGIVFERMVDGRVLSFGTTGKLRKSDLVMYDRQTQSWWQQFNGTAIVGALTGNVLKVLPARLESFANFKSRTSNGVILVPDNSDLRRYGTNPYVGYDRRDRPYGFFREDLPTDIAALARVVRVGDRFWSLDHLRQTGQIIDDDLRLTFEPGQVSVLDTAVISKGRDVGNVVVERMGEDGTWQDIAYTVDFAFAVHSFAPDAKISGLD